MFIILCKFFTTPSPVSPVASAQIVILFWPFRACTFTNTWFMHSVSTGFPLFPGTNRTMAVHPTAQKCICMCLTSVYRAINKNRNNGLHFTYKSFPRPVGRNPPSLPRSPDFPRWPAAVSLGEGRSKKRVVHNLQNLQNNISFKKKHENVVESWIFSVYSPKNFNLDNRITIFFAVVILVVELWYEL